MSNQKEFSHGCSGKGIGGCSTGGSSRARPEDEGLPGVRHPEEAAQRRHGRVHQAEGQGDAAEAEDTTASLEGWWCEGCGAHVYHDKKPLFPWDYDPGICSWCDTMRKFDITKDRWA